MVRLNVDVIVGVTKPAALAVVKATKTIPIVPPNAIEHRFDCQPCAPRWQSYRRCAVDRRSQRKTPANTKDGGTGAVARGGALESRQLRNRIFLERDARCGACAGTDSSIPRGAR